MTRRRHALAVTARRRHALAALAALVLLAGTAAAHVPAFAAGNTTPETAHEVEPPTTSWAIYDSLAAGQVRYYELHLEAGQRLELSLFAPREGAFVPSMVVMSPAIEADEAAPDGVVVPEGYGTVVVEGERPARPTFEAATPAAIYRTAAFSRRVDEGGRYLVAVYEPAGRAGRVGVVAGHRESFTLAQYLSVAVDRPRIYLWGGDGPLAVVGPPLAVLLGGLVALRERLRSLSATRVRATTAAAGLLVVGSATGVLVQLVQALAATGPTAAAIATALFVAVPAGLGLVLVRLSVRKTFELTPASRGLLAVVGVGSLATWAGYLVGPAVALALAAWPGAPLSE